MQLISEAIVSTSYIMEVEQLQLWARWLELQTNRFIALMELVKKEEAAECSRRKEDVGTRQQRRRVIWTR